ncbi:hypothetical protein V2A60_010032 [Cordyceps javanica]
MSTATAFIVIFFLLLESGPSQDAGWADFLLNLILTLLMFLPGCLHAFYIVYVYYDRRERAREGRYPTKPSRGVFSKKVQTSGQDYLHGTIAPQT